MKRGASWDTIRSSSGRRLVDCCTKCWSNLTLKCNANTFVKVDAKVKKECRRTICYLQGYSCPKLYCKKLSNNAETYEFSSQYKRNNFMLNAGQGSSTLLYSRPSLFEPIFNNNTKTTKNYNHHRATKKFHFTLLSLQPFKIQIIIVTRF